MVLKAKPEANPNLPPVPSQTRFLTNFGSFSKPNQWPVLSSTGRTSRSSPVFKTMQITLYN